MKKSHRCDNRKSKYAERLRHLAMRYTWSSESKNLIGRRSTNINNTSESKFDRATSYSSKKDKNIMSFVVGGRLFQTFAETLIPKYGTRLSWLAQGRHRQPFAMDNENRDYEYRDGIYFFDRDPDFFGYLLEFYRTDELHIPPSACPHFLKEELRFWGIPDLLIQPCCLANFKNIHEASRQLVPMEERIEKAMRYREENFVSLLKMKHLDITQKACCHLRTIFDDIYRTSAAGKMYAFMAVFMTVLQLLLTSLMTTSPFRVYVTDVTAHSSVIGFLVSNPKSLLMGIDFLCLIYFFTEYILRYLVDRHQYDFLTSPLNFNDGFCNIVSLGTFIAWISVKRKFLVLDIIFYTVRILRVLRLLRYIRRLEVIAMTFYNCKREIILFSTFCLIGSVISGTLIYLAELVEEQPDNQMTNVFVAFYFAVISWTTVGYGDVVPKSTLSHIFTLIVCWVATITILLPIPLMANTFAFFYRHFQHTVKRADLRGRQRMKRILQRCVEEEPQLLGKTTTSTNSSVSE